MMYEMWKGESKPTLAPIQGVFNLPQHIVMVWEQLAFDDDLSYTQQENGLQPRQIL